ncbi:UNVERIFIED_ORG: hypothetical protein CLV66_11246 [Actinomadura viridilutea]
MPIPATRDATRDDDRPTRSGERRTPTRDDQHRR